MTRKPAPELPWRFGLPLAVIFAVALTFISRGMDDRPFREETWYFAFVGFPFIVLALAKVRDWAAWATAVLLTGAVFALFAWEASLHRGANIPLGFVYLLSPLILTGLSLSVAGMRGRIAWAVEGDEARGSA